MARSLPSFVRPSQRFGIIRTQRPTTSYEGVALSVECDQSPLEARQTLEALLGPATVVVASGGEWTNPKTAEIEPKLHLHWRLNKPTATPEEHEKLKEARRLATELVGGDGTNISIVHPIRWPGSWHRKGTPRIAKIVASSDGTRLIWSKRLSFFATRPAPPPSPVLVLRRTASFVRVIRQP